MPQYSVNISSILKTLGSEFEITGEYMLPELVSGGEIYAVKGTVQLELLLQNIGPGIRVSGLVSADLLHDCSRCLNPSVTGVQADVDEVFYLAVHGEYDEEPDTYKVEHDSVDLAALIQESLLINLPVAPLCRPDCRGICPVCGQNLNDADCGHQPAAGARKPVELRELLSPKQGSGL